MKLMYKNNIPFDNAGATRLLYCIWMHLSVTILKKFVISVNCYIHINYLRRGVVFAVSSEVAAIGIDTVVELA